MDVLERIRNIDRNKLIIFLAGYVVLSSLLVWAFKPIYLASLIIVMGAPTLFNWLILKNSFQVCTLCSSVVFYLSYILNSFFLLHQRFDKWISNMECVAALLLKDEVLFCNKKLFSHLKSIFHNKRLFDMTLLVFFKPERQFFLK